MTMDLIKRIDDLVPKVGGRFALAALIQRRLQEITTTAPQFLHQTSESPIRLVIREIEQGKIELEPDEDKADLSILGE